MSSETDRIHPTLTSKQIEALEELKGIRGSNVAQVAASIIGEWLYEEDIYSKVDNDES